MITTATTTLPPYLSNPAGTKACNFLNHIDKYTITDITLLEEIAIKSENQDQERGANHYLFGTGRCSTALASLCFSAIEQIGMLIRGDLASANMRDVLKKGNVDNAYSFFTYVGQQGLMLVTFEEVVSLYYLFRNKITHNLFPSHNLGVAQNLSNPLNHLVIQIDGAYSLNVNSLSSLVKSTTKSLKEVFCNVANPSFLSMVESNISLIEKEEEINLTNKYNDKTIADVQACFKRWLPHMNF